MKVYQRLAELLTWNPPTGSESEERKYKEIDRLMGSAPHGSGVDGDTTINEDKSSDKRMEIKTEYHYMDSNGFYGPWLNLTIAITPVLTPVGYDIAIKCAEDIDLLNTISQEQAYDHILLNYPEIDLEGPEYEELEQETSEYIDWDSIRDYVSDCFCNWLDSEYK